MLEPLDKVVDPIVLVFALDWLGLEISRPVMSTAFCMEVAGPSYG